MRFHLMASPRCAQLAAGEAQAIGLLVQSQARHQG
jgi:hypothetical protein